MYELFIGSFVTFFVVIDPLGIAPIFAVMSDGASPSYKRSMIFKATFAGAIILLTFAFVGNGLLSALGISLLAFKAAGGVLLLLIALDMVFEKRTERREKASAEFAHEHVENEPEVYHDEEYDDISIFPMAIPFLAGPGSIAYILLVMGKHSESLQEQAVIIGAMLAVLLLTVVILLAASKIIDLMGQTIANAITRILGVLLAALATQYIFDGIRGTFFQ